MIIVGDFWVPSAITRNAPGPASGSSFRYFQARLRPGVTVEQAEAQLNVIAARRKSQFPREYPETFLLAGELLPPRRRQPVVLELPFALLRHFPLRCHPPFSLQSMQGRVEGSMLDLQHVVRHPLDVLGDLVAVGGSEQQGPENEHVQGALKQFDPVGPRCPSLVLAYLRGTLLPLLALTRCNGGAMPHCLRGATERSRGGSNPRPLA